MDHELLASPIPKKLQQSMTEPRIPDIPQNLTRNPSSERIIPISISPKPFIRSPKPNSNHETKPHTTTTDTTNNNDYYKQVSDIISNNNNNNHENLQRRSLLVTLDDGSTTETLGSIKDIESENNPSKRLKDIEIEIEVNNSHNHQSQQQQQPQYSHLLDR